MMQECYLGRITELAKENAGLGMQSGHAADARDRYYGLWQDAIAKEPKKAGRPRKRA